MGGLSICTVGSSCIPEYHKHALAVVREAFSIAIILGVLSFFNAERSTMILSKK